MLENVLKPKETITVHARKHFLGALGRNWIKRAKKGHLLRKSTIFSKFAGCQWVNALYLINTSRKSQKLMPWAFIRSFTAGKE